MTTLQVEEWKIEKRGRSCTLCGRPFRSEEEHYSGIAEAGNRFERRDFCLACWEQKPGLFSFWRTQTPRVEERRLENMAAMIEFFKRLVATPPEDPSRRKIAYLIALLLVRKRRLRLAGSRNGVLRLEKSWDGETIEIAEPFIPDGEIEDLRRQMEEIFEVEFPSGGPDPGP